MIHEIRGFYFFVGILGVCLLCGCVEVMQSEVKSRPLVANPALVAHADEIDIQPSGKVAYKKLVTGEDVVVQLRGQPRHIQELVFEERLPTKILFYAHDENSPVRCHSSPRDAGCRDLVVLVYDAEYGVYMYLDMYIMEACSIADDNGEFQSWLARVLNAQLLGQ